MGETDEERRARERCGATCGRQRSPGKLNSRLRARGPGRPRAGVGGSPGPSRPGAGPEAGRSLTVLRRRRQRSGRARPSSCGAAPRPGPAPPGPAARPPARSRPQRAATSLGTCPEPEAPRATVHWGGGCLGALPLRRHGGSGLPAHFRSGRTRGGEEGRTEVGGPWVPRSAGWAGPGWLRGTASGWACGAAPLLFSGCSLPRSRTGACWTAGLAALAPGWEDGCSAPVLSQPGLAPP